MMERRNTRKRSPLPYLILNVIVSALTTLLVLWLWSRAQGKLPNMSQGSELQNNTIPAYTAPTATSLPPLPPLENPALVIVNVFGTGDLENEVVVLQNVLDSEVWLGGWQIVDENGNQYTFQSLVLNHNAQIQLFSRPGFDTVNSLFWGQNEAVWQPGETVKLIDYQGETRSTLKIP